MAPRSARIMHHTMRFYIMRGPKGPDLCPTGAAMTPAHTRRNGKLYRYYLSTDALKRDADSCPIRRVPAGEIEAGVIDQLRGCCARLSIVVRTWRAARQSGEEISEPEVREALDSLDPLWGELFPAEQARIVQLLVERVDIHPELDECAAPHRWIDQVGR